MAQAKAPAGFKPAYTMERILKTDENGEIVKDDAGNPQCVGVHLRRAKPKWNLSPDLIMKSSQEGWMRLDGSTLTVTHSEGVLKYKVVSTPGYFCCHCGIALPEGGATAQMHVATHGGAESPDPQNPAGYKRNNYYACELVEE